MWDAGNGLRSRSLRSKRRLVELGKENSNGPPSLHYGVASVSHASACRAEARFWQSQNQRRRMVEPSGIEPLTSTMPL